MMRRVTNLLELVGAVLVTVGTGLWSVPAGLVVAGLSCVVFGVLIGDG